MAKQTSLYAQHVKAQAKIVDFAGWDMPLHYGSQLKEHHAVRQHVGMFDVSHMGVVDIQGAGSTAYLRYLLANDIDRLQIGKALYTCMLNEQGGVIDDLIVYQFAEDCYRAVINAGTRDKDLAWMRLHAKPFATEITERQDLAMLAIQGPAAKETIRAILSAAELEAVLHLKPFTFSRSNEKMIARTGYTGEDGFEMIFSNQQAAEYWQALLEVGVKPCGLGARDTLRLEAGLNLYGADMDETVTPLESNLAWTVMMTPPERDFIGRTALEKQVQEGISHRLVGLVLEGPGVIRNHQKVFVMEDGQGEVTSGGYSPTLGKSIALARVPTVIGERCYVEIRNKQVPAQVVKPPFVRHGKRMV